MAVCARVLLGWWFATTLATVFAQTPAPPALAPQLSGPAIRLEIADTGQESRRPESGWCGEAAIQMALSFYGAYASQQAIHQAGKPAHEDLYSHEIPLAMKALGLEYVAWRGDGLHAYLAWIRDQLGQAHPVLAGVKIYPTAHPEWSLDHFILVVGCAKETLTYNTTWGRSATQSLTKLSATDKGLSFANPFDHYYGYAITGLERRSARDELPPTRLTLQRSGEQHVDLCVRVEKLERGRRYRLAKFKDLRAAQKSDAPGELVRSFLADGPSMSYTERIDMDDARVYRCTPE